MGAGRDVCGKFNSDSTTTWGTVVDPPTIHAVADPPVPGATNRLIPHWWWSRWTAHNCLSRWSICCWFCDWLSRHSFTSSDVVVADGVGPPCIWVTGSEVSLHWDSQSGRPVCAEGMPMNCSHKRLRSAALVSLQNSARASLFSLVRYSANAYAWRVLRFFSIITRFLIASAIGFPFRTDSSLMFYIYMLNLGCFGPTWFPLAPFRSYLSTNVTSVTSSPPSPFITTIPDFRYLLRYCQIPFHDVVGTDRIVTGQGMS